MLGLFPHRSSKEGPLEITGAHSTERLFIVDSTVSLRFNGHFYRWTWVNRHRKCLHSWFIGAKDDGNGGDSRSYDISKAPDKPTPSFLTGQMPFLSLNQQCHSTEGNHVDR